jgi:hypothetical protein
MTNAQEIKAKALELSIGALALLPQEEFVRRLKSQGEINKLLADLVILQSHTFEDYLTGKQG